MTASANASLATVVVQGQTFPAVTRGNCRTCQSQHRWSIERNLVAGRSYTAVAAGLPVGAGLSARNIGDHFRNGHLPLDSPGVRNFARDDAWQRGALAEVYTSAVVDHMTLAKMVVHRVQERLANGDLVPSARDGMLAARLLMDAEPSSAGTFGTDEAAAVVRYFEAARSVMEPGQWSQFLQRIRDDRLLQDLVAQTYD